MPAVDNGFAPKPADTLAVDIGHSIASVSMSTPVTELESLSARVERRLAVPVLVAALLSVPAVFLAGWGSGGWARAGTALDWTAGAVLWLEGLVGFILAEDRWDWLVRHKWTLTVALLTVPALIFALGPAQLLRIAYLVSTLRILRVRRIISSATTVHRRLSPRGPWRVVLIGVTGLLATVFVVVLLADPNAETWIVAEMTAKRLGAVPAVIIGVILSVAGYLLWRNRQRDED